MHAPFSIVPPVTPLKYSQAVEWCNEHGTDYTEKYLLEAWGWNAPGKDCRQRVRTFFKNHPEIKRKDQRKQGRVKHKLKQNERPALVAVPYSTPPALPPVPSPRRVDPIVPPPVRHMPSAFGRWLLGIPLMLLAVAWGATGAILNYRYALSLAEGTFAGALVANLMVGYDGLTILLPSAGRYFWRYGSRSLSMIAWMAYVPALVMTIISASGFVVSNLGDSRLARQDIADQRQRLDGEITELRTRVHTVAELRSVEVIEAAIQRVRWSIPPEIWQRTRGCQTVKWPESIRACDPWIREQAARTEADGRAQLKAKLVEIEAKRDTLPAIAAASPGTEFLAFSLVTERDVATTQRVLLMVGPLLAGWLFNFATELLRRHKPQV